jgi:gas vesicle protein
MNWLKELAPLVGTALGGPLGGAAAAFIADKLGIEENTVEAVSNVLNSGKMTADQIAALKLAEIDFQKFLEEKGIDLERITAADRDSARQMNIATRSWVPSALSMLVTAGYFGILVGMMTGLLAVTDSQAMLIMLGSLGTAWGMVMAFWFGTTHGSQQKNDLLANSTPAK